MMDCYERDFSSQSEDFQCGMDMQLNECWVTNVHFQWNEVGGWEAQELFGDRYTELKLSTVRGDVLTV